MNELTRPSLGGDFKAQAHILIEGLPDDASWEDLMRVLAKSRPIEANSTALRPYGLCRGEFTVPDDFDEALPDDLMLEFEG
jgi:hypothetical protein